MDVVDRLIAFKDSTGLSNSQFADKAGIPRPTLSQFLNGRNKRMSDDLINKLHAAYPSLNLYWLLFGEGDMVTARNIETSEGKNSPVKTDSKTQMVEEQGYEISYIASHPDEISGGNKTQIENSTLFDSKIGDTANKMDNSEVQVENHPFFKVQDVGTDSARKIESIMVFYSDKSFEIFTPGWEK